MNKEHQIAKQFAEALGIDFALISQYYPRINEPLGKPSLLDIGKREFFYWTDKGVIDIPKSAKGQSPWSRLNLYEIFWIQIVKGLREFNLPFAALIKLKEQMFRNIFDDLKENKEYAIQKFRENIDDQSFLKELEDFLDGKSNDNEELMRTYGLSISPIAGILTNILLLYNHTTMIVCKDGDEFRFLLENYNFSNDPFIQEQIALAKERTHLILHLRDLVEEYLLEPKFEKLNEDFGFITEEEKQILKAIRDKNVREIIIKKDDNENITLTATSRNEIKDDQVNMIKRILRMNEFDEVKVVLRNEKHLYIENKKKIKIRPVDTARRKNKN